MVDGCCHRQDLIASGLQPVLCIYRGLYSFYYKTSNSNIMRSFLMAQYLFGVNRSNNSSASQQQCCQCVKFQNNYVNSTPVLWLKSLSEVARQYVISLNEYRYSPCVYMRLVRYRLYLKLPIALYTIHTSLSISHTCHT